MVKRQLDANELRVTENAIKNNEEELEYVEAMLKQQRTALEIAPIIARQQIKAISKNLKMWEEQETHLKFTIETSKKQVEEGVEVVDNH